MRFRAAWNRLRGSLPKKAYSLRSQKRKMCMVILLPEGNTIAPSVTGAVDEQHNRGDELPDVSTNSFP